MMKRRDVLSKIDRTQRFIRGFEECIQCMAQTRAVPLPLCYVRSKTYFKFEETANQDSNIYLFDSPCEDIEAYFSYLNNFEYLNSDHVLGKNMIEYIVSNNCTRINNLGKWMLITKIKIKVKYDNMCTSIVLSPPLWLLKYRYEEDGQPLKLTDITDKNNFEKFQSNRDWLNYFEASYNLIAENNLYEKSKPNLELMQSISKVPKNWTIENDEELAYLLKDIINTDIPGSIRNLIKNISVPSTSGDTENLISLDRRTYWESSDCYESCNVIKMSLKPGKKIKQLYIVVSKKNRRYMPKEIQVNGGEGPEDVTELNKVIIKPHEDGDVLILENCSKMYDYLEIRIKSNQRQGTYNRVYGIKMFMQSEGDESLPSEIFLEKNLKHTNPRLSNFKPTFLYRRAEVLVRFIKLFDICMDAILPTRTYDDYFQNLIKSVKKLLILSSRRMSLLEKILNSIPTTVTIPHISIDRPLAFAYRGKVELDPKYQNTIFMQIFNSLSTNRHIDYRWHKNLDQWWECKFIGEGIIDQGGGFRDSLSDIAEELCPNTALDSIVPLPFFIRSPNQHQSDMNTFKDTFIPNPSCVLFNEYEFIGKLMGACYRSRETLALYLSPLFWKKLSGEKITWKSDFITVDASQVELLDSIEKMDKEEYELKYAGEITWSCVLSDGSLHILQANGHHKQVSYEERIDYCEQVKKARLTEADKQIDAIRKGLISVLSIHILYILTSQEFELEICGAPEISYEDLKMSVEYDDELTVLHDRVIYFWQAIKSFTNEERSKFVRFVTGRKRLPVKIFFSCSDQPSTSFPDSSTCSCSIYFPEYPNAQVATEKLRYAIHNCVAIDTDNCSYGSYGEVE